MAKTAARTKSNTEHIADSKAPELVAMRRRQLIDAAIVLFSKVGYYSTTVKDVADAAGVSAGLVYQYVADKEDLLFACLVHICEENKKEIPAAVENIDDKLLRLFYSVEAYARVIAANRRAVLLTYRETQSLKDENIVMLKNLELETNRLIEDCAMDCIDDGLIAPVNVELLVYRIIINAHAWAIKYWRLKNIISFEEYVQESVHSCWVSLLTPKGRRRYDKLIVQPSRYAADPRN